MTEEFEDRIARLREITPPPVATTMEQEYWRAIGIQIAQVAHDIVSETKRAAFPQGREAAAEAGRDMQAALSKAAEAAKSSVKDDPASSILADNDLFAFKDGDEKRRWLVAIAILNAYAAVAQRAPA